MWFVCFQVEDRGFSVPTGAHICCIRHDVHEHVQSQNGDALVSHDFLSVDDLDLCAGGVRYFSAVGACHVSTDEWRS